MAAAVERTTAVARKPDRVGVVAIVHDQATLDRIQGVIRELQLDDELSFEATLDAALRAHPRRVDAARSRRFERVAGADPDERARAGGADLKILALGASTMSGFTAT